MPFVSFHCPGLTADLDAAQTRAFAMRLRRMADDADALAARLDGLLHPGGKGGTAAAGTVKAA